MKRVDITEFDPGTHTNVTIAGANLADDGIVSFDGETDIFPSEITVPGNARPVTVKDGLAYLEALRYEFTTPQAMASDVYEA